MASSALPHTNPVEVRLDPLIINRDGTRLATFLRRQNDVIGPFLASPSVINLTATGGEADMTRTWEIRRC